jgi:hypothetical protein
METMESAFSCKNNAPKLPCKNGPQFGDNFSALPSVACPKTILQYGTEAPALGGLGEGSEWSPTEHVLELVAKLPTALRMIALGL